MARDRASVRGTSGSETVSSVSAPPRRAVNQGTECRHPVAPRGGVTPSSTTSEPPCPEAGSPTLATSSLGWSASPGSETSAVRIRPGCTTPSRRPQQADTLLEFSRIRPGGVTPSSTTSEPPGPEAGSPTLAQSSWGWSASPGSETSSVRIRPVCTTPSRRPQKADTLLEFSRIRPGGAGQAPLLGGNSALRRCVAAHSATARRRRPTGSPHRQVARAGGTCPPTPVRGSLLRVAGRMMRAHRPPALGGSGTGGGLPCSRGVPRPTPGRRPGSSPERGGGPTRRPAS